MLRPLLILAVFILSSCGQSEPPAKGEAGPPGPTSGANGPTIKVIARPCNQPACGAIRDENEQILNAYALNPGGVISFIDQRNVTFRPNGRPTVLVLVCTGK